MAYVHQVSFTILPDQMSELRMGASLERVIGYLRTLLPNEPGHIESRGFFTVDMPETIQVIFQSTWQTWTDLLAHRDSQLLEDKVLTEFASDVRVEDLVVHDYGEIP